MAKKYFNTLRSFTYEHWILAIRAFTRRALQYACMLTCHVIRFSSLLNWCPIFHKKSFNVSNYIFCNSTASIYVLYANLYSWCVSMIGLGYMPMTLLLVVFYEPLQIYIAHVLWVWHVIDLYCMDWQQYGKLTTDLLFIEFWYGCDIILMIERHVY